MEGMLTTRWFQLNFTIPTSESAASVQILYTSSSDLLGTSGDTLVCISAYGGWSALELVSFSMVSSISFQYLDFLS